MPRVIFIGDVHNVDNSIVDNYGRFEHKHGDIIGKTFALLFEIDFDGDPDVNANQTIEIITGNKPGRGDWALLTRLANNASVCYGFDSDESIYSLDRQNQQYKNIKRLISKIRKTQNIDILVIVGSAHLEINAECDNWVPHHEKLYGALKKDVYCYSKFEDGSILDYDD